MKGLARSILVSLVMLVPIEAVSAQWTFVRVDDGTKPAIALGPDCVAEVSYMLERTNGYVRHARIPAGGPPSVVQVADGYFYGPLDVAASHSGSVYVNYHDHDIEDQVVAVRSGDTWTLEPVVDPGHDGWDNSILVTEGGIVHTSSVDPSGFAGRGVEHARRSTTGVWNVEPVGSPAIMYANATSIVISPNGDPAIAYYNDVTAHLELAERVGGVWSVSVVDSVGDVGRFPSLAIDVFGELHLAYYEHLGGSEGVIRYARQTGETWEFAAVDTLFDVMLGFTGARRNVALVTDGENIIHVVYGDRSVVKYARGTQGAWTRETVVDESATATVLGQQVDAARCADDGAMHVVYYEVGSPGSIGPVWYGTSGSQVGLDERYGRRESGIQVYPNPSRGDVTILVSGRITDRAAPLTLKVFDVLGRLTLAQSVSAHGVVDVSVPASGLSSGVYVILLQAGSGGHVASFVVAKRR